jgi:hypothetical protein
MASSDPYDDGFFDDPEAIRAIVAAEAQAVSASQTKAPQTQRYHHTVSAPRAGPSLAPFGRRKDGSARDPAPLNVQPGLVAGGFGWEAGGKRVAEGNIARHLEAIEKRQAYWGTGKEAETPIEITVDATGRYETRPDQEDVVDKRHLPITLAASQARPPDAKSAQARRQAIAAAAIKDRPFVRSISASSHMLDPASQGMNVTVEKMQSADWLLV